MTDADKVKIVKAYEVLEKSAASWAGAGQWAKDMGTKAWEKGKEFARSNTGKTLIGGAGVAGIALLHRAIQARRAAKAGNRVSRFVAKHPTMSKGLALGGLGGAAYGGAQAAQKYYDWDKPTTVSRKRRTMFIN